MAIAKFVALLVVAFSLIQIGEAQNFHYINEVQHGQQYSGSVRYMNSIPMVLGSLIICHCLKFFPAPLGHYR